MTRESPDFIILDDIGTSIGPREDNPDSNFVSELLSYSSGILEQASAKVIITTNLKVSDIDEALVRPGRCFDFITLEALTTNEAKNIWTSLLEMTEESFVNLYKHRKKITQATLINDYKQLKRSSTIRRYMKDGTENDTLTERIEKLTNKRNGTAL